MSAPKSLLVIATMLALALGLFACSSTASSGSSASAASDAASSSAQAASDAAADSENASAPASASLAETAKSASSSAAATDTAAETAGFDFVDECTDEHGNISLYALTELKGWQVETLLDQQGYKWDEGNLAWTRAEDGASFSAYKETGTYTQETYDQMNEKGGAIAAIGFNIVAGYKDPQAALSGNARCVIEASYFNGDDGIAIFYGPSMKEYLAIIGPYSESTTQFMIFSKEAVGSGMADDMLGTTVGGSFKDVWKSVTGQDSYN